MRTLAEIRCFGGVQGVHAHASATTGCEMVFGLYLPPAAERGPVPLLWCLAGVTADHATLMERSGVQARAAARGFAVVFPDTSPRGTAVPDDPSDYLGQGASYYVNACRAPWERHYRMWDYLSEELPRVLFNNFPLDEERQAITGHSMGGHGALTLALHHPGRFASVSAFAPVAHPTASVRARAALEAYLGPDAAALARHDATLLLRERGCAAPILIDQGTADPHVAELMPEALADAMAGRRQPGAFRMQAGYDHGHFFVASFMPDHAAFHAQALGLR